MKIRVTEADIKNPCVTALSNPISHAIRRSTGQWCYVFSGNSIYPMKAPQESIPLPRQVSNWWQQYQENKDKDLQPVPPIEFELELK